MYKVVTKRGLNEAKTTIFEMEAPLIAHYAMAGAKSSDEYIKSKEVA